jgi:hypothetical protein
VLDTGGARCRIGVLTRCNNHGLLDPSSTPLSSPYTFVCHIFLYSIIGRSRGIRKNSPKRDVLTRAYSSVNNTTFYM